LQRALDQWLNKLSETAKPEVRLLGSIGQFEEAIHAKAS
jgi:hypothetical protein